MLKHFQVFLFLALFTVPCRPADVIFGRRVYAEHTRTYQQIWTLDSRTRRIAALTSSERRHAQPACAPGGKRIWFLSGAFGDETNHTLWWFDSDSKKETLALTFPGSILRVWGGQGNSAFFLGLQGDHTAVYEWTGKLRKLSATAASALDPVRVAPDGKTLAVQTGDVAEVTMIEASGARGRVIENCSGPVWSADMRKLACVSGKSVRVIDLTTGIEAAHIDFLERATPPAVVDFDLGGANVLVKTVGASQNSTSPQSDFWTLEIAIAKWTFAGPGQTAIFAPEGGVLMVTPRELTPVGKRQDWTSQLLLSEPLRRSQQPLAAGTSSNVEPSRCPASAAIIAKSVKGGIVSLKQVRGSTPPASRKQ